MLSIDEARIERESLTRSIVTESDTHQRRAFNTGRCHTDASGYWGPWTYAETTFSNEYFRLLLEETWTLKTSHQGARPRLDSRRYSERGLRKTSVGS